jgi:hypothetical protein
LLSIGDGSTNEYVKSRQILGFSHDFLNNTNMKCVGKVTLIGGIGLDTYKNAGTNQFAATNFEDFEGLIGTGLPI